MVTGTRKSYPRERPTSDSRLQALPSTHDNNPKDNNRRASHPLQNHRRAHILRIPLLPNPVPMPLHVHSSTYRSTTCAIKGRERSTVSPVYTQIPDALCYCQDAVDSGVFPPWSNRRLEQRRGREARVKKRHAQLLVDNTPLIATRSSRSKDGTGTTPKPIHGGKKRIARR